MFMPKKFKNKGTLIGKIPLKRKSIQQNNLTSKYWRQLLLNEITSICCNSNVYPSNILQYDYNTNMIVRSQPHAGRDTVRPRGILNQNNF